MDKITAAFAVLQWHKCFVFVFWIKKYLVPLMTDLGSRFVQPEEKGRKKQLILANLLLVDTLYLSFC